MSKPILKVETLSKSFGGLRAVANVSFQVRKGEILGLIGPNGAGKTTLFNLITGFLKPDGGSVYFQGEEITNLKPHRICRLGVARTFQVTKPFSRISVLENIATAALLRYPRPKDAENQAFHIAQRIGLENELDKMGGDLTVGNMKKVGFAQALATEPQVVLLDEIMAGLNPSEIAEILSIIRSVVSKGVTVMMVEHVMEAVMNICDRILVMEEGKLIAEGSPQEIAENERVIEAYLGKKYEIG